MEKDEWNFFICPACDGQGKIEGHPDLRMQTGPDSEDIMKMKILRLEEEIRVFKGLMTPAYDVSRETIKG